MERRAKRRESGFAAYVLDQLGRLPDLSARAMFGGHGLYSGESFFGLVYEGRLYFYTSDASRPRYVAHGSGPFRPRPKQTLSNYYEVPVDVLEDHARILEWANEAIRARTEGKR